VNWVKEDDDHSLWLYMPCGLARIDRAALDAWISGVEKNNHPEHAIQLTFFDSLDGVRSLAESGHYSPPVAKSPDGKLWFLPWDGVSVIDPRHIRLNRLPPPVRVEQVTANQTTYDPASATNGAMQLPPLVRALEIDYTALSFVAPEKVFFRYKLENFDRDWQEAGTRRQAFYNNLSPGNYHFRVIACNNSGIWNEEGATFDFSIAPAYYQTAWFRALCVAVFAAFLWALFQLRQWQMQHQFNMRLEARVHERMRIARELHDTLLQSFHGLMFRFQAARNMLPRRPEEAMQALDGAISRAEQAIAESRNAIQDLRSATAGQADLAQSLTAIGQELAARNGNHDSPLFQVIVEGERRKLAPVFQDEAYRMGRELLQNAFQHACAHEIEVEIRYDHRMFRLRIRDDGKGIDPKVLEQGGRRGHWGLPGVRERAQQIGAQLDFWSEAGAGTEIQLTVPAHIAYAKSQDSSGLWPFGKTKGNEQS
jgi:signal transduction histidine kinase